MKSIIIIDDEKEICESIKMILEYENYHVEYSTDSEEGFNKLHYFDFDALLLDIQMPKLNGFEVLKKIRDNDIQISTIIITAHSSLENAIKATKLGAFDFLEKPIDRDKLLITIRNAVNNSKLIKENKNLKDNFNEGGLIIGKSQEIKQILDTVKRVAKTDARILITGENGTGKELIAKAIHNQSSRANNELIEVNCAAMPNELIESELFGHEKGAFTGAIHQRIGKFEQAHKSTLFLDEIGDMSLQAQAKVLRAIEEGIIERVGSGKKISVDVRIIAATNKDLSKEIAKGNFREDLFHRLNVIPIKIPPLRERKADIPILIDYFTKKICAQNKFSPKSFSKESIDLLTSLPWRGNVRELKNIIERIVIMVPKEFIKENDIKGILPPTISKPDDILNINNSFQEFKEKAEKIFILKQLNANNWNISKTAEVLQIQRSHLDRKSVV